MENIGDIKVGDEYNHACGCDVEKAPLRKWTCGIPRDLELFDRV